MGHRLTKELYRAMKERIRPAPAGVAQDMREHYPETDFTTLTVYRFDATGLGEDFDSVVQPMRTKNLWNVCQRFYGFALLQSGGDADALDRALLRE